MRKSETPHTQGAQRWGTRLHKTSRARAEVRGLGGFQRSLQDDEKRRPLVNGKSPCLTDGSKVVICDGLYG